MGVPRTVPPIHVTGQTHGTSYVGMGVLRTVSPVPCGTMGRESVPRVPCGTMGRDGHMGQAMYDGTHGSP